MGMTPRRTQSIQMLHLRNKGVEWAAIGRRYGISDAAVQIRVARLKSIRAAILDGGKLRATRQRCGLSQCVLADLIGISNPEMIRRWESGDHVPSGTWLIRIMMALNVAPSQIIQQEESK